MLTDSKLIWLMNRSFKRHPHFVALHWALKCRSGFNLRLIKLNQQGGWCFNQWTCCRVAATASCFSSQPQCGQSPTLIPAHWNLLTVSLLQFCKEKKKQAFTSTSCSHFPPHKNKTPFRQILTQNWAINTYIINTHSRTTSVALRLIFRFVVCFN